MRQESHSISWSGLTLLNFSEALFLTDGTTLLGVKLSNFRFYVIAENPDNVLNIATPEAE
jgi:hypothetical protein